MQAGGALASRTLAVPVHITRTAVQRVSSYGYSKGLKKEHLTAVAGTLTGLLVSALVVKCVIELPHWLICCQIFVFISRDAQGSNCNAHKSLQ